jgi:excisionase family DNA binding protein
MSTIGPITLRLFTVEEAADTLKLPKSWLYERTRKNAIPFRRMGKYVRFTAEDITEIIGVHTIPAIPPDRAI